MSIIAIIPARGGSKSVPRKNVLDFLGLPLIAHSIIDAKEAQLVDRIYVSTDDGEIAQVSRQYGAEIIDRPAELAKDTSSSESALIHALSEIETTGIVPELVVFLQCTSPVRTGADIDQAITKLQQENADSLIAVSPTHRFLWKEVDGIAESINYDYRHRQRRQDMEPQYMENGSMYLFKPWVIKELGNRLGGKVILSVMSEAAIWEIDSILDFKIAEVLFKKEIELGAS